MRASIFGLIFAAAALTGCAKPPKPNPALNCVDPAFQNTVLDMLFQTSRSLVDSNLGAGGLSDGTAVKAEIENLRASKVLSVKLASFEGYDEKLDRISCSATLQYELRPEDITPIARAAAVHVDGLSPPADLYGEAPTSTVDYTIQPTPDGQNSNVSATNFGEAENAIMLLAITQWRLHSTSEKGAK